MYDLPPICGREAELMQLMQQQPPLWRDHSNLDLRAAARTVVRCTASTHHSRRSDGALISHLQYMAEHQGEGQPQR